MIAGSGGGGGYRRGGAGGGETGGNGEGGDGQSSGGTQTAGGSGGSGVPGTKYTGGNGDSRGQQNAQALDGGGGGAGYFGGQGGTSDAGGGSGGSGYCSGQCTNQQGSQGGSVGEGPTAPPMANAEGYIPGCGEGRQGDGANGCISISHNGEGPLTVSDYNPTVEPVAATEMALGTPIEAQCEGSGRYFTVPSDTEAVRIHMWGAGGAGRTGSYDNHPGGSGGYAEGLMTVTPGQTLFLIVGCGGKHGTSVGGDGGYPGGGYGTRGDASGGGGGGLVCLFTADPTQGGEVIMCAGSGGGAGYM